SPRRPGIFRSSRRDNRRPLSRPLRSKRTTEGNGASKTDTPAGADARELKNPGRANGLENEARDRFHGERDPNPPCYANQTRPLRNRMIHSRKGAQVRPREWFSPPLFHVQPRAFPARNRRP